MNVEPNQHWNYRIVQTGSTDSDRHYGIYEVYYQDGEPWLRTLSTSGIGGETMDEVREDLEFHRQALERPVLIDSDFNPGAVPAPEFPKSPTKQDEHLGNSEIFLGALHEVREQVTRIADGLEILIEMLKAQNGT